MAIVLPLFFFFFFALAELCLLYNARQIVDLSAFRACRSFVAAEDNDQAEQAVKQTLCALTPLTELTDYFDLSLFQEDNRIQATVVYLYKPVFPILPLSRLFGRLFLSQNLAPAVAALLAKQGSSSFQEHLAHTIPLLAQVELVR